MTCDLIMPGVDGVEFIRRQMAIQPIPIIVISIAAESSERVLSALDAGALDFVQKPTALATEKIFDIAEDLVAKINAAAGAPLARPPQPARTVADPIRASFSNRYDLLAIGVPTLGWAEGRNFFVKAGSGAEIGRYLEARPEEAEDVMLVLRYFDPVNFADMVSCRLLSALDLRMMLFRRKRCMRLPTICGDRSKS